MPAVVYPPRPTRLVIVRNGLGQLGHEPIVDHPPGYHVPDKSRAAVTSRQIAEYCVEQVLYEALPYYDERTRIVSERVARSAALDRLPAVLYRLRIEGLRYGTHQRSAAIAALTAIRETRLPMSGIPDVISARTPAQWTRFFNRR